MKQLSRLICILICVLIPLSAAVVSASDYEGHWAAGAIDTLRGKGIVSGDSDGNMYPDAAITRAVLNGEKGPKRNAVVLNAAAGLVIGQDGIDLREAIHEMEKIIDSGKAAEQLEKFIQLSNEKCSAA